MKTFLLSLYIGVFVAIATGTTIAFQNSEQPVNTAAPGEIPEETRQPVTHAPLPSTCKNIIKSYTCQDTLCWAQANAMDCVDLEFDLVNITMSMPAVDPKCDPAEKVCITITDKTVVQVYGYLGWVPQTVLIIDQEGFVKVELVMGPTQPVPSPPITPDHTEIPIDEPFFYPDNCTHMITSMICEGKYCWAEVKKGYCADMVIYGSEQIVTTSPLYSPFCNVNHEICVNYMGSDKVLRIRGAVMQIPFTVAEYDQWKNTLHTWNFVDKVPEFPIEPAPEMPSENSTEGTSQPVLPYPQGCKRIVKDMLCNGIPCWIEASAGDCVEQTIQTDDIALTIPAADNYCDPAKQICVSNINGKTITVRGYLDSVPQQAALITSSGVVKMLINMQPTTPETNVPGAEKVTVLPVSSLPVYMQSIIANFMENAQTGGGSQGGSTGDENTASTPDNGSSDQGSSTTTASSGSENSENPGEDSSSPTDQTTTSGSVNLIFTASLVTVLASLLLLC